MIEVNPDDVFLPESAELQENWIRDWGLPRPFNGETWAKFIKEQNAIIAEAKKSNVLNELKEAEIFSFRPDEDEIHLVLTSNIFAPSRVVRLTKYQLKSLAKELLALSYTLKEPEVRVK
jgi:hypothetical protein